MTRQATRPQSASQPPSMKVRELWEAEGRERRELEESDLGDEMVGMVEDEVAGSIEEREVREAQDEAIYEARVEKFERRWSEDLEAQIGRSIDLASHIWRSAGSLDRSERSSDQGDAVENLGM